MSLHEWDADVDHIGFIKVQSVPTLPASVPDDERRLIYTEDTKQLYVSDGTAWNLIGGTSSLHNSLLSKQGGTTDEYYHLTATQFANAQALSGCLVQSSYSILAGSVEDQNDSTPGYIDASTTVENDGTINPSFEYMQGFSVPVQRTSGQDLSTIFPISVSRENYATKIEYQGLFSRQGLFSADEDFARGVVWLYWGAQACRGYIQVTSGGGYLYHNCYLFSGSLSSLSPQTIVGSLVNGKFSSPGDAPQITAYAIVAPTDYSISQLPMVGDFRNVMYQITNYKRLS